MPSVPDLNDVERTLRGLLRGRTMVFEIGLDEADFHRYRKSFFAALRERPLPQLRLRYPALLTTYMSMAGTFLYDGQYWPHVHPWIQGPDVEAGKYFIAAARSLGLETFDQIIEQESAWRWVSRILAQGGIPRSGLEPFAELVAREVETGATDGAAVIARWRARDTVLRQLHVPTRRFLLYGGKPASDLVDRCMEAVREQHSSGRLPAPAEAGLPAYVLEGLERITRTRNPTRRRAHSANLDGVRRPRISIDPYDGLGPILDLPTVSADRLSGAWRVAVAGTVERVPASAYASAAVRVPPLESVDVEFLDGDGTRRSWSFEPLGKRGLVVFDPESATLLGDGTLIAADEAWVLAPSVSSLRARSPSGEQEPREVQGLPSPSGAWAGFVLRHLDLRGVTGLIVGDGDAATEVAVTGARARPELGPGAVTGVRTGSGLPVFAAVPEIRVPITEVPWRVRVATGGQTITEDIPASDGRIDISGLLGADCFGTVQVRVRGSLGSDRALGFAIIPDLRVTVPSGVVLPGSAAAVARLEAPGVQFGEQPQPAPLLLDLRSGHAHGFVTSAHNPAGASVELQLDVPVLRWSVVHDTKPALEPSASRLRIDAEEFDDHLADLLLVDCGRPGVELRLELCDRDDRVLITTAPVRTASRGGRWSFDLGFAADTIRAADGARLGLRLSVDGRTVAIGDIVKGVRLTYLAAMSSPEAVVLTFGQKAAVPGRVARLWSADRPWEAAISAPVADGSFEAAFERASELAPGPYLAEIAVEDPWTTAVRPRASAETVRPITVGDADERLAYLASLDPGDPRSLLTWALAGYHGETEFETGALSDIAEELATTLLTLLTDTGIGQGSGRKFSAVASLATARDTILAAVLDALADLDADAPTLARLSLRLLECLDPTSDPLDPQQLEIAWRVAPAVAARLDAPWAAMDPAAAERCRAHLGWAPGDEQPPTSGARLGQMEVQLPAQVLRDLPFTAGIRSRGLLSAELRQLAMFDWLQSQRAANENDEQAPKSWYFRHRYLTEIGEVDIPSGVRDIVQSHLDARRPSGAEEWAAVPVVLLAALTHVLWPSPQRRQAAIAVDEAVGWATRAIASDMTLLAVSPLLATEEPA